MARKSSPKKIAPPLLVPQPKKLDLDPEGRRFRVAVPGGDTSAPDPAALRRAAEAATKTVRVGDLGEEGYRLAISPEGIVLEHTGDRGAYYGAITLWLLAAQYAGDIPCLRVEDAPDFPNRGFMLDVSRGKVPKLETLYELIDLLSFLKYNQFQLYVEHVYAFRKHPLLGKGHSPLTASDLQALDAYCAKKRVTFVPNLQSFGHHWHTLRHPKYKHLAESEYRGGWTLCPVEPATYDFLRDLYDEYLPNFSRTDLFNVGCDETWDLGKGRSKPEAEKIGLGRLYLNHILKVHELARHEQRRIMFWGDIIAHYPKLLADIPKDVVLLNWGYEAHGQEKQYRKRLAPAAKSGLEHYVCPGTSAWNSFFFRMENARVNLRKMAIEGLKAGASGYLVTDWGDHNHYNFQSFSLWPIAYGADCAWRSAPDRAAEKRFDDRFVRLFLDDAGRFVEPLRALGEIYRALGVLIPNNSAERWLFTGYPVPDVLGVRGELNAYDAISVEALEKALELAETASRSLGGFDPGVPESRVVRDEWALGADLAAHACRRALYHNHGRYDGPALRAELAGLAKRMEEGWMRRNRPSDFDGIRADFVRIAEGYAASPRPRLEFVA